MLVPALLYVIALVLRVAWVLWVPSKPVGDFAMYIESATHLRFHGAFDPQFVYMPGYIFVVAAVQALGGKWLALKLVGAGLSAMGAPLCHGIAARLWDRRVAVAAGALYAVWPGGIGVASVTGTDIPAAIFVAFGVRALVAASPERPWRAGWAAGALLGLAAWVRAVAVPLAPLTVFFYAARTRHVRRTLIATACTTIAAVLVLAPWGLRNHARYGTFFLTDSHGGLTALVGAYPNSDGQFTRALNRTFELATGIPWLSEPHREADELAYAEAKRWTRFEPAFALGLALQRADKLLSNERSLLYWPLYRAGVLDDGTRAPFDRWRREIEAGTDFFWWFLLLGCVAAVPLAIARRNWQALALLPMQLALTGVYVLFFAESRYHLTIAVLAFPGAAATGIFLGDGLRAAIGPARGSRTSNVRVLLAMSLTLAGVLAAWRLGMAWGDALREHHRWAVHACTVRGAPTFCRWKRADAGRDPSPVRGVFDGVGLRLNGQPQATALVLALPAGPHRLHGQVSLLVSKTPENPPSEPLSAEVTLTVNGKAAFHATLRTSEAVPLHLPFVAQAGANEFVWSVTVARGHARHASAWLDGLGVVETSKPDSLPAQ